MMRLSSRFLLLAPCGCPYAGARLAVFPDFFAVFDLNNNVFGRSFVAVFAKRLILAVIRTSKTTQKKAGVIFLRIRCQNTFWGPPKMITPAHGCVRNSRFFRPLHQAQGDTVVRHINIPNGIIRLFFSSRPSAIFRAIGSVVVNALKSMFFGWMPHVSQKRVKIIPGWANFNASTAIACVMRCFRVIASGLHLDPNSVNSRIGQSVSFGHVAVITYCKELSNEL